MLWLLLVYFPFVHMIWGGGLLAEWGVLDFAGVAGELVRWNESGRRLADFAGFVVPGGFSYQDRVRAV